jgi:hypothetical protein
MDKNNQDSRQRMEDERRYRGYTDANVRLRESKDEIENA